MKARVQLITLLLCMLQCYLQSSRAQPFAYLRTATVDLGQRPQESTEGTSDGSVTVVRQRFGTAAGGPSSSKWGPFRQAEQFLVGVHSQHSKQALFKQLAGSNAVPSTFIPDKTWLVVGPRKVVAKATTAAGAPMAEYRPEYKIAPEWLSVAPPSTARSRRMQESASAGLEAGRPTPQLQPPFRIARTAGPAARRQRLLQEAGGSSPDQQGQGQQGDSATLVVQVQFPILRKQRVAAMAGGGKAALAADMAAAAAEDWAAPLAEALLESGGAAGCAPVLVPTGKRTLDVAVCQADLWEALTWLSEQPLAHYLLPKLEATNNDIFSDAISLLGSLPNSTLLTHLAPSAMPLWNAGVDGRGQIMGVGDTGVDIDSCYLFDPAVDFASNLQTVGDIQVFESKTHRKLAYYYGYQGVRDEDGHGSHVSGIALGAKLPPNNKTRYEVDVATGMAPGARLAFYDIFNGQGDSLVTPEDLVGEYYDVQYKAGARVHSDSWGYRRFYGYNYDSQAVDQFLWDHPDFLSIFAAGNSGDRVSQVGTVEPPANSKNTISVGATLNYQEASSASNGVANLYVTLTAVDGDGTTVFSGTVRTYIGDDFGSIRPLLGVPMQVVQADPYTACTPLTNDVRGKVVMALRGGNNCYFYVKAGTVADAGGATLIIVNNQAGLFTPGYNPNNVSVPVSSISLDDGDSVMGYVADPSLTVYAVYKFASSTDPNTPFQNVAAFSSYGPTGDGRFKPDIMAPGAPVLSILTDKAQTGTMDQCATTRLSGTSMAAPVVSGAAVLARQYFMEGFYPGGVANQSTRFTPSGMLLKAVLLGSAVPMDGVALNVNQKLDTTPSGLQGFGRLDLSQALPLAGPNKTAAPFNLQLVDKVNIKLGDTHSYQLQGIGGGKVSVTLVWYDYPASVNAATLLVNDLDLTVTVTAAGSSKVYYGNMGLGPDRVNNVERVVLEGAVLVPDGATIAINVTAVDLPSFDFDPTPQLYALTIQGSFKKKLGGKYNPGNKAPATPAYKAVSARPGIGADRLVSRSKRS